MSRRGEAYKLKTTEKRGGVAFRSVRIGIIFVGLSEKGRLGPEKFMFYIKKTFS